MQGRMAIRPRFCIKEAEVMSLGFLDIWFQQLLI